MAFLVRITPVLRVSEYKGTTKDGNEYCVASWKVKNVVDGTVMLVSCFEKDDEVLKANPTLAMEATLTVICRDWNKDGRSGCMNNVTLTNVIGPEKEADVPGQEVRQQNTVPQFGAGTVDDENTLPF